MRNDSTERNYTIPLEQALRLLERVDEQGRALFRELHLPGGEFHDVDGVPWVSPAVTVIAPVKQPTGAGVSGRQQRVSGSV